MNEFDDNRTVSARWRTQLHTIICEADTLGGQLFDIVLLISIALSVLAVPTGIVSLELARPFGPVSRQACPDCGREGHSADVICCQICAAVL